MQYADVTHYVVTARLELQDKIPPYRYDDQTLVRALNRGLASIRRIRPDILLDLKYMRPLRKGDTGDGSPDSYSTSDIAFDSSGVYLEGKGTLVPVPNDYISPLQYFINGWVQTLDVTDSQDQRAQAFLTKFQQQLMSVNAA